MHILSHLHNMTPRHQVPLVKNGALKAFSLNNNCEGTYHATITC